MYLLEKWFDTEETKNFDIFRYIFVIYYGNLVYDIKFKYLVNCVWEGRKGIYDKQGIGYL